MLAAVLLPALLALSCAAQPFIESLNGSIVLTTGLGANVQLVSAVANGDGSTSTQQDVLVGRAEIATLISVAIGAAVAPLQQQLATETSRAVAAEMDLNQTLGQLASALTLAESQRALAAEASIVVTLIQEQSRASKAEQQQASLGANLLSLESSLSTNIDTKTLTELSRAVQAETSISETVVLERSRAVQAETSIAGSVLSERSRAVTAEASLALSASSAVGGLTASNAAVAVSLSLEVSRATGAEASLSTSLSQAVASVALERSRALTSESLLAANLQSEISRAVQAEGSVVASQTLINAALSASITATASAQIATDSSIAKVVANISTNKVTSYPLLCVPGAWATAISGAVGGCTITQYVTAPSIVIAMFDGHCQVTSGWLYTGISVNGDFPLASDISTSPMATGAGYAPSHTYSTVWENTRTARAAYVAPFTTLTLQVKWLSSASGAGCNGYSLKAMVISDNALPTLPNQIRLSSSNIFGCTYASWSYSITAAQNNIACTASFTSPYNMISWSYFGGHETQTAGSNYGFISIDGDAVAPLADYTTANSVSSSYTGASSWEGFNSGRVKYLATGAHTAALSFYPPAGATVVAFNGGGLLGLYIPADPNVGAGQAFRASANALVAITTTPTLVCSVTITLPYRATVWAEFTASAKVSSSWMYGTVDFDGDTISPLTVVDNTLLPIGPAHTYATVFKSFGNGRAAVLTPGTHTISLYGRASVGGTFQISSLDGFYVSY
eukprot:m.239257 g.239257  ORF g.239257 m.239257 type:complete len:739 (+) comp13456_c0_seq1:35-2251(+)